MGLDWQPPVNSLKQGADPVIWRSHLAESLLLIGLYPNQKMLSPGPEHVRPTISGWHSHHLE